MISDPGRCYHSTYFQEEDLEDMGHGDVVAQGALNDSLLSTWVAYSKVGKKPSFI